MDSYCFKIEIRDSTHFQRARNFCYENKFSSEGFLANNHWQLSPRFLSGVRIYSSNMKTPTNADAFILAERVGLELLSRFREIKIFAILGTLNIMQIHHGKS
ncbi:hypothetical protein BH23PAT2_BH23PAT2_09920 [soil metagenome]